MDTFRVPRVEIEARIQLQDGHEISGQIFVPEVGPSGGPGRLVDRLDDHEEPFLPVSTAHGPVVVNVHRILTVRVQSDPEGHDESLTDLVPVHVRMAGGAVVMGNIRYSMPAERSRLLDYLNAAPRFVRIETEHGDVLVQRRLVTSVRQGE